jgi:hypothetical protein
MLDQSFYQKKLLFGYFKDCAKGGRLVIRVYISDPDNDLNDADLFAQTETERGS